GRRVGAALTGRERGGEEDGSAEAEESGDRPHPPTAVPYLWGSVSSRSLGIPRRMHAASYIWRAAFCAFCSSARRSLTFASSCWICSSSSVISRRVTAIVFS